MSDEKAGRTRTAAEAREELLACRDLAVALRERLRRLRQSIPPTAEELANLDIPTNPEEATEIRGSIEVVINDHLDSVIVILTDAHAYRHDSRA